MIFGGTPSATLTAPAIDAPGDGCLRLTDTAAFQHGYAYNNTVSFPSRYGVDISFEYFTYGGTGADGITFFLFDASTAAFDLGAPGGSLGYAQDCNRKGLTGAYVGIGLDEYGNFSNTNDCKTGGVGFEPNAVVIRGAAADNYPYLGGAQTTLRLAGGGPSRATGPADTNYRKAHILLSTRPEGGYNVKVEISTGGDIITSTTVLNDIALSHPAPARFKFGLAAATGASTNIHEVRNLVITVDPSALLTAPVAVNDPGGIMCAGQSRTINIIANDTSKNEGGEINPATIDLDTAAAGVQQSLSTAAGVYNVNTGTGELTFTAAPGFSGRAALGYLVKDTYGSTSNPATVSFYVAPVASISIDTSSTRSVCYSMPAALYAKISPGAYPSYACTWETSTDGISDWTTLAGRNDAVLQTDSLIADRYFRVTVTDNRCMADSTSPAFLVRVVPPAVASAGPDQVQYDSGRFTMTAVAPATGSGVWSLLDGTAIIANQADPATAVTITPNSSATLRWTVSPTPACPPASDDVTIQYLRQADLLLVNTGPSNKAAGQAISYRLLVTNNGPSNATGVHIQDLIPAAVTEISYAVTASGTARVISSTRDSNTLSIYADIAAGAGNSILLEINGVISPDAVIGSITNTATATLPPGITETDPATNSSSISTNINTNVGLQISKSGPALANAGSDITYTIEVTNTGSSNAVGVLLLDNVPAGISNVTWTAIATGNGGTTVSKSGGAGNGINLTANIEGATAGPGKVVVTINGIVSAAADSTIINTATIEYAGNKQSAATTAVNHSADLRIVQTAPTLINAGDSIRYELEITNTGPANANAALLTDTIPEQVKNINWTAITTGNASFNAPADGSNIIRLLASIPPGPDNSIRITVTGTVDPAFRGLLLNTATLLPPPGIPDPSPAISTASTAVGRRHDLQITKNGPSSIAAGQHISYTVSVWNNGPSAADSVRVRDLLPSKVQDISWTAAASGNGTRILGPANGTGNNILLCAHINGGPGNRIDLNINGTVDPAYSGALSNTATAAADTTTVTSTVHTLVHQKAGLEIVTSGPSSITAGQNIEYTLAVSNQGPSDAHNLLITDQVPPQVQQVSWTASASGKGARITGNNSGTGNNIAVSGHLAATADNRINVTINGRIDPSFTGTLRNVAAVAAGDSTPVYSAAVATTVIRQTGLLISKSAPATAKPNDSITYIIRVGNAGPSNALEALITDRIPDGIGNISWTAATTGSAGINRGSSGQGRDISVSANIPAGPDNMVTITVTGRVLSRFSGLLKNVAGVKPLSGPAIMSDTCITAVKPIADIQVLKSGPATTLPGSSISYTIQVSNAGPGNADTVTVTDIVPAAITVQQWAVTATSGNSTIYGPTSGSGNQVQVKARLANGAQFRISIQGLVNPAASGNIYNIARAALSPGITDPSPNDSSSVTTQIPIVQAPPAADLVMQQAILSNMPYKTGQRVDYSITLRNNGPDTATGILVTDLLPGGLGAPFQLLADKGSADYNTANGTIRWLIDALPAGDKAMLNFRTQLEEEGSIANQVQAWGHEEDPDTVSNRAILTISVTGDIFIPNTITPNGDGKNDRFIIPGLERYPNSLLEVYNRLGNQVYHSNNYSNNWDGAGLTTGTYFYILQIRKPEGVKVYKGWIELLR
jgi:gliding motility-associated-like protein/uncharacterized repeat protein (TIGR01451 family)